MGVSMQGQGGSWGEAEMPVSTLAAMPHTLLVLRSPLLRNHPQPPSPHLEHWTSAHPSLLIRCISCIIQCFDLFQSIFPVSHHMSRSQAFCVAAAVPVVALLWWRRSQTAPSSIPDATVTLIIPVRSLTTQPPGNPAFILMLGREYLSHGL